MRNGQRYLTEVISVSEQQIRIRPIQVEAIPAKLPVHLILALPRPKVLRRIIMDAVTLGVERISLIHSYRVDKKLLAKPILQQLDDYVTLGLEQAGDTISPEIQMYKRFKPFVEDVLPTFISDQNLLMSHIPMQNSRCLMRFNIHVARSLGQKVDLFLMRLICSKNGCQADALRQTEFYELKRRYHIF